MLISFGISEIYLALLFLMMFLSLFSLSLSLVCCNKRIIIISILNAYQCLFYNYESTVVWFMFSKNNNNNDDDDDGQLNSDAYIQAHVIQYKCVHKISHINTHKWTRTHIHSPFLPLSLARTHASVILPYKITTFQIIHTLSTSQEQKQQQ